MTIDDPYDLERFVAAQNRDGTYQRALEELRRGRKMSHWMWFVFPQIAGLGHSPTSRKYAITSLEEAKAYLQHPWLGARLVECAEVVANTRDRTPQQLFGGTDAKKLHSCMTLFQRAAPDQTLFGQVLDQHFDGVGDRVTDQLV